MGRIVSRVFWREVARSCSSLCKGKADGVLRGIFEYHVLNSETNSVMSSLAGNGLLGLLSLVLVATQLKQSV